MPEIGDGEGEITKQLQLCGSKYRYAKNRYGYGHYIMKNKTKTNRHKRKQTTVTKTSNLKFSTINHIKKCSCHYALQKAKICNKNNLETKAMPRKNERRNFDVVSTSIPR